MNNKCLHITHNDADAIGCAIVAVFMYQKYNFKDNTRFCPVNGADEVLNKELDSFESRNEIPEIVIISDINISEESCKRLESLKDKGLKILQGFDHHVTNKTNLNHDWFKVVSGQVKTIGEPHLESAAMLMYRELCIPYIETHTIDAVLIDKFTELIYLISRYDTWEWKNHPEETYLPFKEDIMAVVSKYATTEFTFNELIKFYESFSIKDRRNVISSSQIVPSEFETIYKIEKIREENYFKYVNNKIKVIKTKINNKDYNIAYMFTEGSSYENEAMSRVLTNDKLDAFWNFIPNKLVISIRTKKEDVDATKIAEYLSLLKPDEKITYGGHVHAAGISLTTESFTKILNNAMLNSIDYNEFIGE